MSEIYFDAGQPSGSKQKVCLATTAYSNLDPAYVFSIQRSRQALSDAGIGSSYLLISGNCHVDDARNCAVKEFLESDCTDLIFLDADVSWDPESLVELCQYDTDLVGGVYPFRRKGKRDVLPVRLLMTDAVLPPDGLLEVEGIPTGFMRIRRNVLENLCSTADHFESEWGRIPILFERTFENGIRWGGDLKFCRKWRDAGGNVFAAPNFRLGHAGRSMNVDSLASTVRRVHGLTLRTICDKIKRKVETPMDYVEVFNYIDNFWGAPPEGLAIAVAAARQAEEPIIEAGSGLTTILMAAATNKTIYCMEHDPFYAYKLERMAKEAGVIGIGICLAPMKDGWYDLEQYQDLPKQFSLGVVDGPPRKISDRFTFFKRFGEICDTIVCDDANDKGYIQQMSKWCHEHNRKITIAEKRTAVIQKRID